MNSSFKNQIPTEQIKSTIKDNLKSTNIPLNIFELSPSNQKIEIKKAFEDLVKTVKKDSRTEEENYLIYLLIFNFYQFLLLDDFYDIILDLDVLPIMNLILNTIKQTETLKSTFLFITNIQINIRGDNLMVKEFKNGSPIFQKILDFIYQANSKDNESIVLAIYAATSLKNLGNIEAFIVNCKTYSPIKLFDAILELIKSNDTVSIEAGSYLLSILATKLVTDLGKGKFYPWQVIVEKNLVKNLKMATNFNDISMANIMNNLQYCASISPTHVGYEGIELARKYYLNKDSGVRLKAVGLLSSILTYARSDSINTRLLKSDGYFEELIQMLKDKDYEYLNQVGRAIMGIFTCSVDTVNLLSEKQVYLLLEKMNTVVRNCLKSDLFFAEATIRHLSASYFPFAKKYSKFIIESKILPSIFTKYYKYQVDGTKSNFITFFAQTLYNISDHIAFELIDQILPDKLQKDKFFDDLAKNMQNKSPEARNLSQNSATLLMKIISYTKQGKETFGDLNMKKEQKMEFCVHKVDNPDLKEKKEKPSYKCYSCKKEKATKLCGRCKIAV